VKRSFPLLVGIAGLTLWADQWTKTWAEETLIARPPVEIIGELLRFTYTRNSGVAFGLGAGHRFPFYWFSLAAVAVILYMFARHREHSLLRHLSLSLILGGALGNLVDRLFRSPGFLKGAVVDFVHVGDFPTFNVADSAITIGAIVIVVWAIRADVREQRRSRDSARDG